LTTGYLEAYAMPAIGAPFWDHTYVVVIDANGSGEAHKCHGRNSGGNLLVGGPGDADRANCLAEPMGGSGISYGRTGVCHQAANRILHPASIMVTRARGYRLSEFQWGTYGREPGS